MMEVMTVNETGSGRTYRAMIGEWATAARDREAFVGVGAAIVGISTFFLALALHGDTYDRGGVPPGIALPGAVAAQLVVIALLTAVMSLYPSARAARWWKLLAIVTGAVMLFFAILPAIVAGYSWLAVLLLAVLTIVYDLVVAAYFAIVRPWAYLNAR